MTVVPPTLTRLRRIALAALLLILAVTTLSAYMRLANAGLGCADWPACYGAQLRTPDAAIAASDTSVAIARVLHRLAAMTVLVLALTIAAAAFSSRPRQVREAALAVALIAVALGLAVLGRYSAGAVLPIIAIGNVLGGFAMVALSFATWRGATPGTRWSRPASVLLALIVVQIASGVLVSASYSGLSCTGFPDCGGAVDLSWSLLDPMRVPRFEASLPIHPEGALAQMLHRGLALLVTLAAVATGIAAWRNGQRRAAAMLVAVLTVQIGLGITLVLAALPFAAALMHNLVAALMLIATMACLRERRAPV
jgi:cytochrome c oxidase assembly protein subunit 15